MKCDKNMMLLYAVTDRAWTGEKTLYEQVEEALKGGVTAVQLREKGLSDEEFLGEAILIAALCKSYGVPLFINDNVKVAIECRAEGIHVGQEDMDCAEVRRRVGKDMMIGVSVHTVEEAIKAEQDGADCLGVGAVFPTSTKTDADALSMDTIRAITDAVDIPVVAIGGLKRGTIDVLKGSGVDGAAIVSGIFASSDIEAECAYLRDKLWEIVHGKPKALSIAGSDSIGGAGIQADIKTMIMNGVYAMTAVTALTAQNTLGVSAISEVCGDFLRAQIDAVFEDIVPDAVKIGMVSSPELIHVIAERLKVYGAKNVVVDPVMVATSGSSLMKDGAVSCMEEELFPIASIITPNIPEAECLSGIRIKDERDMKTVAGVLYKKYGCAVLLKGGHSVSDANDLLFDETGAEWIMGRRIDNPNTHGTGCTLSSAIASGLAKGRTLRCAVRLAKEYISGALEAGLDLGRGAGPLDHGYIMETRMTNCDYP